VWGVGADCSSKGLVQGETQRQLTRRFLSKVPEHRRTPTTCTLPLVSAPNQFSDLLSPSPFPLSRYWTETQFTGGGIPSSSIDPDGAGPAGQIGIVRAAFPTENCANGLSEHFKVDKTDSKGKDNKGGFKGCQYYTQTLGVGQ